MLMLLQNVCIRLKWGGANEEVNGDVNCGGIVGG